MRIPLAAFLAATLTNAHAVELSKDGLGEAFLLPYYAVTDNRASVISVENVTDKAKAVRVLLAEGRNGRPVLTFNLYLRPLSGWSGTVRQSASNEYPILVSSEDTCLIAGTSVLQGEIPLGDQDFSGQSDDGLGQGPERTREGHVEIIELGLLKGQASELVAMGDCASLAKRFESGNTWDLNPYADIGHPKGGLFADAEIVDVATGAIHDTSSVAIDDFGSFSRNGNGRLDRHDVRLTNPKLGFGSSYGFFIENSFRVASTRGEDVLGILLAKQNFDSSFDLGLESGGRTEWIVTLPTRHAHLDSSIGSIRGAGVAPKAPFQSAFNIAGAQCVSTAWEVRTRDGTELGPQSIPLCNQVNRIEFVKGDIAHLDEISTLGLDEGFVRIDFSGDGRETAFDQVSGPIGFHAGAVKGLPAIVTVLTERMPVSTLKTHLNYK